MGFFGCMNMYSLRVNMSVAIVCMTEDQNVMTSNSSDIDSANVSQENLKEGEIDEVWLLLFNKLLRIILLV
jgi:hypothetical protein